MWPVWSRAEQDPRRNFVFVVGDWHGCSNKCGFTGVKVFCCSVSSFLGILYLICYCFKEWRIPWQCWETHRMVVVIQNRLVSRAEAKWVILAQESGFSKNLMLEQPQFSQLWCVYLLWSARAEFVLPSDCSVSNFQKSSMVRLARYKAKEFFLDGGNKNGS